MKKQLLMLVCSLAFFTYSYAATITWDGGASTTTWSDAANWVGDVVPGTGDDVDIDGATVILTASTQVQRVYVRGSGHLTINVSVVLTVDGFAGDDGLEINTSATCINNGTITISNIAGSGSDGLFSKGTFTNNGSISIDGVSYHGFYMQGGTFINSSGATLSVTNVGQSDATREHLYLDDNSGTGAVFTNNGTVTVAMVSGDEGIYLNDGSAFNNNSIINMTNGAGTHIGLYVIDNSTFTNGVNGEVTITAPTSYGIQIDANSNASPATITNSGTITVTNGSDDGLRIQEEGVMINNSGATLTFTTSGDEGIQIDADDATTVSTLTNNGTIDITGSIDHGMEVFGTVSNGGTINLTTSGDVGLQVASSSGGTQATFTNTSTGTVTITNPVNHCIQIDGNSSGSPATISNSGTISITDGGTVGSTDGIRIREAGTMTVNSGGIVNITDAEDEGIELDNPSTLNNSGTINITNSADHGMDIQGTFNNNNGGLYKAQDSGDDGIRVVNSDGPGSVVNNGSINIFGSTDNDIETDAGASFTNGATANFIPGNEYNFLEIKKDFNLGSAKVTIQIKGTTAATDYDQIINIDNANAITITNATLHLDWGAFTPTVGNEFKVIDGSGSVTGTFSSITTSNSNITTSVDYASNTDEVKITVTAVTPVELVSFTGKKSDKGVQLSWETGSEENNEGFDIERSIDGEHWKTIGYVRGNGNSTELLQYTYLDETPSHGTNYYRLKQNDFDGQFEYSNTISLDFINEKSEFVLYPNPVEEVLYIDSNQASELLEVQLYDANGRLLWTEKGVVQQISFADYSPGLYFLKIVSSTNQTIQKVIHN